MMRHARRYCTVLLLVGLAGPFGSLAWGAEIPRAEHPRPDFQRDAWLSLNGEWQFEIDDKDDGVSRELMSGKDLASKIIVPFCPESKLSGIAHYDLMKHVWYRRMFEVPVAMRGKRILLHFGAVDYQATVWVNGQLLGTHIGGSAPFTFEITKVLRDGNNEVVVHGFDDTASGRQPTGKQTFTVSEGCVYTRTTGIWQPVWLEAVGSSYVDSFSVFPDPDRSRVLIEASVNGPAPGLQLTVEAFAGQDKVGSDSCPVSWRNHRLVVDLTKRTLWEPGKPFLYDLKFTLTRGSETIDTVSSYFGLRKVSIKGRSILINGKRVFQRLILDQGFYPEGIWTAPSDDELREDIERSMAAGYNGARLHQKVFEPRFLYWADKLGYLVWGEFPSWGFNLRPENYSNYLNEWTEIVLRDRNHPAIIGWCPFNETSEKAGEIQQMVWHETGAIDPTRVLLETSGYTHTLPNSEVRDDHDYNQDPKSFKEHWESFFGQAAASNKPARYGASAGDTGVPFMVSEFGGTFWGENKEGGWGYGNGPKSLDEFYTRYEGLVNALLDNPNMFGFAYTQLTDVEQEHNGLYYYDRRPKFDLKKLHAITSREAAYEKTGPTAPLPGSKTDEAWQVLVGARQDGELSRPYHYTTQAPAGEWAGAVFDDSAWKTAPAPFGTINNPKTQWNTSDIWLRQTFEWNGDKLQRGALVVFYDEDTDVFVNGQKIWTHSGFTTSYDMFDVSDALKKALMKGQNALAVHTHQTGGGQYIDLAILAQ